MYFVRVGKNLTKKLRTLLSDLNIIITEQLCFHRDKKKFVWQESTFVAASAHFRPAALDGKRCSFFPFFLRTFCSVTNIFLMISIWIFTPFFLRVCFYSYGKGKLFCVFVKRRVRESVNFTPVVN